MARLLVMYKTPKDAGAFDAYYFNTHVPIAKQIPGLRKYEVSKGQVATPTGPSGVHLVAMLHFDDAAAIQKAFASADRNSACGMNNGQPKRAVSHAALPRWSGW